MMWFNIPLIAMAGGYVSFVHYLLYFVMEMTYLPLDEMHVHITKTRLFKYIEHFTTKKLKIFR